MGADLEPFKANLSHFFSCFSHMPDTRQADRIRYPMPEVLFLVVCSTVSGYETNRSIEEFGNMKLDWLRHYFPFEHGIPHHETIGNIIGLIDKRAFELAFLDWIDLQFGRQAVNAIHIDGKRIKGSVDKSLKNKPSTEGGQHSQLIINAYASDANLVEAQVDASESDSDKEGAESLI